MCRSLATSCLTLFAALLVGVSLPVAGQGCNNPPHAGDDVADHVGKVVVVDVLANDSDPDGEALWVDVVGWTCHGTVEEDLGLVTLSPAEPVPEDCTISYRLEDERGGLSDTAAVTVRAIAGIFADGFESGHASAWSECQPQCP